MSPIVEFIKNVIVAALLVAAALQPVILAAVTWLSGVGVKGNWLFVSSLLIGGFLGCCAMVAIVGIPTNFAGWFALLFYFLIPGLVASGVYDTGKKLASA